MITFLLGIFQVLKSYNPSFTDFLPKGKRLFISSIFDVFLFNLYLYFNELITFEAYVYSILIVVFIFVFIGGRLVVTTKYLKEANSEISKARNNQRKYSMKDADKIKYINSLEAQIKDLKNEINSISETMDDDKLFRDNLKLKEQLEDLAIENDKLANSKNSAGNPDWMNYLPYNDGDSLDDVKKAYRALAKIYHPDKSVEDENRIRNLNRAWKEAQKFFN